MARKAGICRRIFARVLALSLLVLQGAILDYYLIIEETSSWWFAWIITDAIVLSAWVLTMWMSHRKSQSINAVAKDQSKFAYIAWVVYAVHLVPQVATLFKLKAPFFDERELVFGPNMLKMNLCLTPMLFLFLMYANHDAKSHSRRKYYLEKMTAAVTLDLFDSAEMLEYLFDKEKITIKLENAILAFSCMNIFLPTFALFELKFNKFHDSGEVSPISFKLIYVCSFMLFVNVPFLVLRVILWHGYQLDVSVLLAKNVLAVILGIIEIFEFFGEQRPRKCEICKKTFAKHFFKEHCRLCSQDENLEMIGFDKARIRQNKNWINGQVTEHLNEPSDNISQINTIFPATSRKTYV